MSTSSMVSGFWGPWNTAAFMGCSFLGQEVADAKARPRGGQKLDGGFGAQRLRRPVAPTERRRLVGDGSSVHLQDAIDEIHDPVVLEPGPGVETALVLTIDAEARLCDLDDEGGPRRMSAAVPPSVAPRPPHPRPGLRLLVQPAGPFPPPAP